MGAASRVAIFVCLITGALAGTGWCASFVYNGTQTARDVATGEKVPLAAYLVLAENGVIDVQGVGVFASGSGGDPIASGGAQLSTSKFSLVRDLTDQAQPGETVDQTVERVVAFLQSRGFTEFVP